MKRTFLILVLLTAYFISEAQLTQWRGPNRDGKFDETGLLKEWPAEGYEILLEVEGIGKGYSSPISDGEFIYTTGMMDSTDNVTCIDFEGNIKWQVPYGRSWEIVPRHKRLGDH